MADWRESVLPDVAYVARHLREADRQEIMAGSGEEPLSVLLRGFLESQPCYTIVSNEGVPIGLFGVVPSYDPMVGGCWAVMTDEIRTIRIEFLRKCGDVIEQLNEKWPILFNYVDARNELHIKWLRAMGFTFIKVHQEHGVEKRPFIEFVRVRNV